MGDGGVEDGGVEDGGVCMGGGVDELLGILLAVPDSQRSTQIHMHTHTFSLSHPQQEI